MLPELLSASVASPSGVLIPAWLDAAAVAVGALSGTLAAHQRKLDLVGFFALSLLGGLGGGLIRDVTMQCGDVYMLTSPYAIPATMVVATLGLLFPNALERHPEVLEWIDIVSVGLFVVAGTDKAMRYGLNPWAIVLMGTLTGVGGGMLRDISLGEVPRIFKRSNFYAICAVAGSLVHWLAALALGVGRLWPMLACMVVVVGLRRYSLRYNVLSFSDADTDLGPAVKRGATSIVNMAKNEGVHQSQRILDRLDANEPSDDK